MNDQTDDPGPLEASPNGGAGGPGGGGEPGKESSADEGLVNFSWFGDWTSWSSALVLVALLPITGACLWPMAAIVAAVLPGSTDLWLLLYFVALPVVLIPGLEFLQVWLIGRGTRRPTAEEQAVLEPAFEDVLSRLGRGSKRRYRLRVIDDDNLNAAAGGGSLVMVTTRAVHTLPDDQLKAVLAHELGHHAGLHPLVLLAQGWMYLPISIVAWLSAKFHNVLAWITGLRMHWGVYLFLMGAALFLRLMLLILGLVLRLANLILVFFGRRAEYRADDMGVALGYGESLEQALRTIEGTVQAQPEPSGVGSWLTNLESTHPPTAKRIERIRKTMAAS